MNKAGNYSICLHKH